MQQITRHIRHWCARHGVTPIEILTVVMVLGVLASLIVPPFSTAATGARELAEKDAALRDALQYVRTQITVFKAQHHDVPPGYPNGNTKLPADGKTFVAQLTEYSDQSCRVSEKPASDFPLGKYLETMPSNPLSGNSAVWIDTAGAPVVADPNKPFGWIYNPQTLDFRANATGTDSQGIAYSDY